VRGGVGGRGREVREVRKGEGREEAGRERGRDNTPDCQMLHR